jgi:predicted lysophospholipase L1 biosynthesis ABC-type transport system permease subunit
MMSVKLGIVAPSKRGGGVAAHVSATRNIIFDPFPFNFRSIFRRAHFRGKLVPALAQLAVKHGDGSHAAQLVEQLISAGKIPSS